MALNLNQKAMDQVKRDDTPKSKKYTVLAVDDEEANLQSIVRVLERKYGILTATNGQEALELIEGMKSPESIHVILADQRMPRLTGVEFLEKTIPIIPKTIRMILTGFSDIDAIIEGINKVGLWTNLSR